MSDSVPSVRLLHDDAGLWPQAKSLVEEDIRLVSDAEEQVIGIVSWTCASKPEVAQLDRLRDDHSGPIVAILERLPTARGARAVSALLEGSVLADGLGQALLPTLRAVAAGQCVVPARSVSCCNVRRCRHANATCSPWSYSISPTPRSPRSSS